MIQNQTLGQSLNAVIIICPYVTRYTGIAKMHSKNTMGRKMMAARSNMTQVIGH